MFGSGASDSPSRFGSPPDCGDLPPRKGVAEEKEEIQAEKNPDGLHPLALKVPKVGKNQGKTLEEKEFIGARVSLRARASSPGPGGPSTLFGVTLSFIPTKGPWDLYEQ